MLALEKKFDAFNQPNIRRFDSVRFAYIQGLYQRAHVTENFSEVSESSDVLAQKISTSIDEYLIDLEKSKVNAEALLADVVEGWSAHADDARLLFDTYQFRALERFVLRLKKQDKQFEPLSDLFNLNQQMQQDAAKVVEPDKSASLDQLLYSHEQQARNSAGCAKQAQPQMEIAGLELQSMKHFRESMKYVNVDKTIERAINDFPANAGPHNPHMLAITALTRMQELSPEYLRRFAAYIETILWLEKNEVKLNRKKNPS